MYTQVNFRKGIIHADGVVVKNSHVLIQWINSAIEANDERAIGYRITNGSVTKEGSGFPYTLNDLLTNPKLHILICPLHYVRDGEFAFICGFEQWRNVSLAPCGCGVPGDVHGTCCGWRNAKVVCDGHRIADSRHPSYNRSINDWINSLNAI
jgi:hypothetical protein